MNPISLILKAQEPDSVCEVFLSPLPESDRADFSLLQKRVIGTYGDYRASYKPGHLHAGIDLEGILKEKVFAIGRGRVTHIFRNFPHKTIVIQHPLADGNSMVSVYTHVEDIRVEVGDFVTEETCLARLFSEDELENSGFGTANHLHLEIRKNYDDKGMASNTSMNREDLDKLCLDPLKFFERRIKAP
jgi:murein DD-endopeptidase MepM/ murein hydrolase activator NlpD